MKDENKILYIPIKISHASETFFFDYYNKVIPEEWDVYILDRPPIKNIKLNKNITRINMYESPLYKKKVKLNDIKEEEKWLGISFDYIISMEDAYFKTKFKPCLKKKKNIVRHIRFFRDFFNKHDINYCLAGFPNNILTIVYYFTMHKMGIKNWDAITEHRGPSLNKYTYDSIVNNKPLFFNKKTGSKNEMLRAINEQTKIFLDASYELYENEVKISSLNFSFSFNNIKTKLNQLITLNKHQSPYESHLEIVGYSGLYLRKFFRAAITNLLRPFIFKKQLNKKFFYFPLHYTRDSALTFGEPFIKQAELIKKIAKSLPTDVSLYIKPHPYYMGSDFSFWEYLKLKSIPNVEIIHYKLNNANIIKRCIGVITINSTTGYEAMLLNKPVITFGDEFYTYKNSCILINNFKELPNILVEITKNPDYLINKKDRNELMYLYHINGFQLEKGLVNLFTANKEGYLLTKKDYEKIKEIHRKTQQFVFKHN